jgi:hypothetical protein
MPVCRSRIRPVPQGRTAHGAVACGKETGAAGVAGAFAQGRPAEMASEIGRMSAELAPYRRGFAAAPDFCAGFLVPGFLAVGFLAAGFLAAGFLAVGVLAAGFFEAAGLAAGFFAGAADFLAAGFVAAGFLAGTFLLFALLPPPSAFGILTPAALLRRVLAASRAALTVPEETSVFPFAERLPIIAPATPPMTAPTGPAMTPPMTAPVTPAAVCFCTERSDLGLEEEDFFLAMTWLSPS